jgi:hypothetical protein
MEQRNGIAWNVELQNLDRKLKAEWDTEGIAGMAETVWEMEMEKNTM